MTILITTVAILFIVGGLGTGWFWMMHMAYASETSDPKLSDYLIVIVPLILSGLGIGLLVWWF